MSNTHWHWNTDDLPVETRLSDIAAQEGNDGPEYDLMQEAAVTIRKLRSEIKTYYALESELHLMRGDTIPAEFAEYHANIINRLMTVLKDGKDRYGRSPEAFYIDKLPDSVKAYIKKVYGS